MQTENKNSNRISGGAEGRGKFTLRRKRQITAAVKVSPARWQIPTPAKNKHRWLTVSETLAQCRLSLTCGKSTAGWFHLVWIGETRRAKAIHLILFITLNATFFVISHGTRTVVHGPECFAVVHICRVTWNHIKEMFTANVQTAKASNKKKTFKPTTLMKNEKNIFLTNTPFWEYMYSINSANLNEIISISLTLFYERLIFLVSFFNHI